MKKRRIKKSIIKVLIVLILIGLIAVILFNLLNNKEDKKEPTEVKPTKTVEIDTKKKMSLVAVGDVLIHESVYKDAKTNTGYDFSKMFTYIKPLIKDYDLKYCNQESTIGGQTLGISGYPSFNSPDEIGDELVDNLGFNLISLANNHSLDKGEDAVLYSVAYWKSKNAHTAGSYSNYEERNSIPVYEENGIKYAFLSYTTISNSKLPAGKDYLINMYSDEKAKQDIDSIKDKVDVIIVSMHWGQEDLTNAPIDSQVRIANYLSSLGVNLILGSHAHVVQPVEYIGDTLVVYGLGNFISNQLVLSVNNAIGLMIGMDIVVDEDKVTFENIKEELVFSYSDNSTNFKVIPFSNMEEKYLSNYEQVKEQYMSIVTIK